MATPLRRQLSTLGAVRAYFAAAGNAGNLPRSRGSCWIANVARPRPPGQCAFTVPAPLSVRHRGAQSGFGPMALISGVHRGLLASDSRIRSGLASSVTIPMSGQHVADKRDHLSAVGWAKRSVPTAKTPIVLVGTLRFAHPTRNANQSLPASDSVTRRCGCGRQAGSTASAGVPK